ncbi:hypothetical protein CCDG5_1558 [[Clostridium] cellulosi]|jgi:Predicted SPOUT methyltransferase.|uniref:Ribosomal RNA large subunit methyltransferase H n=1 Tax=[Clostridium] cellulosi TaxID=29343 RepID=A0A078KQE8_9FIRM|nr:MAG: 23S rRNA (pseudouridine(1915)-N(3))-methyltransferase RlmH [[Clostridium] cellulosi]CDZ24668.1 hypothetical protein CCDG5_1558 [[Clostridium] cellulosi]
MLSIDIICVGNLKEKYWRLAFDEYVKRLTPWAKIRVTEIPEQRVNKDTDALILSALTEEGRRITAAIPDKAFVTALCIEGKRLSSVQLSEVLSKEMTTGTSSFAFIIGGSYGLSDEVKTRANLKLSMSDMTFPHQLARIMLIEQLYRSMTILNGVKYHK